MSQCHLQNTARAAPASQELLEGQSEAPRATGRDALGAGAAVEGEPREIGAVDRLGVVFAHGETLIL
eukprot:8811674-Pyramimonas_sp.AAC.1